MYNLYFILYLHYKKQGMCEGASKQFPDPKNSTAPPVLKFVDPPLLEALMKNLLLFIPQFFCLTKLLKNLKCFFRKGFKDINWLPSSINNIMTLSRNHAVKLTSYFHKITAWFSACICKAAFTLTSKAVLPYVMELSVRTSKAIYYFFHKLSIRTLYAIMNYMPMNHTQMMQNWDL